MNPITAIILLLLILVSLSFLLLKASAASIANAIRVSGPILLIAAGGGLTFAGRGGIGIPLLMIGLSLFARVRNAGKIKTAASGGQKSTVRSAWLEMELDHDTGRMEGFVLTGSFDGRFLSELSRAELLELYVGLQDDTESEALLAAYLDRQIADWREEVGTRASSGEGDSLSAGPMTREDAYQILGLEPGAGTSEIKQAHRRLMKQMHPDNGGSTFLAAKINQAKDTLLEK